MSDFIWVDEPFSPEQINSIINNPKGQMDNEYKHGEMVSRLIKPGVDILREMSPEQANLLHMAVGVSGEAGELLDAVKKTAIYGRAIDLSNVIEELGDLEFYIEGVRQALDIRRNDVLAANIAKLTKRFGEGKYSNQQAQTRADKACDHDAPVLRNGVWLCPKCGVHSITQH